MKEVNYYCDICKDKIPQPHAEDSCYKLSLDVMKDWDNDMSRARLLYDKRLCKKCGTQIESIIGRAIHGGGFQNV